MRQTQTSSWAARRACHVRVLEVHLPRADLWCIDIEKDRTGRQKNVGAPEPDESDQTLLWGRGGEKLECKYTVKVRPLSFLVLNVQAEDLWPNEEQHTRDSKREPRQVKRKSEQVIFEAYFRLSALLIGRPVRDILPNFCKEEFVIFLAR